MLPLGKILLNEGQLGWLPRNPRSWTQTDIDNTAKSILEDQDFLEDRPILVVPFNEGVYIAFAGNLRHEGASATKKVKKVPCVIYYPETAEDYETVKRRAIKDNGSFGKWDTDIAANEWGDNIPWAAWGAPDWAGGGFQHGPETPGATSDAAPEEENLPEELRGVDLAPEDLEKLEGEDKTPMERIIICYKPDDADSLGKLLGMPGSPEKVVYTFTENGLE